MGDWKVKSGWMWIIGCTNPLFTERNGRTTTFGHAWVDDDEDLLKRATRACKHCATPVPVTYKLSARVRCAACQKITQPWEGMLCPECQWPVQRMQCHLAEKDGEQAWHTIKVLR